MQAEAILLDGTIKGPIHSFFYPIKYVQVFRPCGWDDVENYLCESDTFREIMSERVEWLVGERIKYIMNFTVDRPDLSLPHHYRLFTEFAYKEGAEAYMTRWNPIGSVCNQ